MNFRQPYEPVLHGWRLAKPGHARMLPLLVYRPALVDGPVFPCT